MLSLKAGSELDLGEVKLFGLSLSGIRTSIAVPELGICFDVAQGLPFALKQKKFFITHSHLDHAAGIPYIISQKALLKDKVPQFYMPKVMCEPLKDIMSIWERLEGHQYNYQFIEIDEGSVIELNAQRFVRPFRTKHRVPSYGYSVFERKKKLAKKYQGLGPAEIQRLKQIGHEVDEIQESPWLSFTGDTQIEFLDLDTWVRKSKFLVVETTFLDEERNTAHARKWGHIHLDELVVRLKDIEAEKIILIHLSSRYPFKQALELIQSKLPKPDQDRVIVFPGQ